MKTVEYFGATDAVELCVTNPYWFMSMEDLNAIAENLKTDLRRILKAVGLHSEFINYGVNVDFSERKICATFDWVTMNREKAMKIIEEAQRRHYKWTNGNPDNKE